jgi:hypothetical protein
MPERAGLNSSRFNTGSWHIIIGPRPHVVTCSTLRQKFVKILWKCSTQDASGRKFMQTKQLGTQQTLGSVIYRGAKTFSMLLASSNYHLLGPLFQLSTVRLVLTKIHIRIKNTDPSYVSCCSKNKYSYHSQTLELYTGNSTGEANGWILSGPLWVIQQKIISLWNPSANSNQQLNSNNP